MLTIENATIGYDQNNLATTLDHIHNDCVERAKTEMRTQLDTLRTEVHACWVGKSAETFMDNMDYDVNLVCEALDKAYESLVAAFNKAVAGLAQIDEDLVDPRG